jgi:hypothetical protein
MENFGRFDGKTTSRAPAGGPGLCFFSIGEKGQTQKEKAPPELGRGPSRVQGQIYFFGAPNEINGLLGRLILAGQHKIQM